MFEIIVLALFIIVSLIAGIVLLFKKKVHPVIGIPVFLLCLITFFIGIPLEILWVYNYQIDKGAKAFIRSVVKNPPNPGVISYSSDATPDEQKQMRDAIKAFPKCNYKVDLSTIWPGGDYFCYDIYFDDGKIFFVIVDVQGGKYAFHKIGGATEVKSEMKPQDK
jgi:hypothetical protein